MSTKVQTIGSAQSGQIPAQNNSGNKDKPINVPLFDSIKTNVKWAWTATSGKVTNFVNEMRALMDKVYKAVTGFFSSRVNWVKEKCGWVETKKSQQNIPPTNTQQTSSDKADKSKKGDKKKKTAELEKGESKKPKGFFSWFRA